MNVIKQNLAVLSLAVCLAGCVSGREDWRIIAVNQDIDRVVMFDGRPGAAPEYTWEWRLKEDPALSLEDRKAVCGLDECKLRDGGKTLMFTAYLGFGTVDCETRRLTSLFRSEGNPHSIERLPGGRLAVADSTSGRGFLLADPSVPFDHARQRVVVAHDTAGAHGVVWDSARNCLWGVAYTNLFRFAYDSATMTLRPEAVYDFVKGGCQDAYGHDLVADGAGGYFFTNHTGVWHFDPETERFSAVSARPNVKSYSPSATRGTLYQLPRERWWSDRIVCENPDGSERTIGPFPGARYYKARWIDGME